MGQLKGHLHYGGSFAGKSGRLGSRPNQKHAFKTQRRYETIIRLENAAFPDSAIAAMMCISISKLSRLKRDPDYLAARIQLTHGIILNNDSQVAQIKEQRKEILTHMLPPALQYLAEEIQKPAQTLAERKHKASIALDLLDREGTFAKVSRTEIKPVDSFDFEKHDAESMLIISALKGVSTDHVQHTEEVVEANRKFSNSHTLSQVEQQKALDDLEADEKELLASLPTDGTVN